MTEKDKALLVSMIANGFEFHKNLAEINGRLISTEELDRVVTEGVKAIDRAVPRKPVDVQEPVVKWGICPSCKGLPKVLGRERRVMGSEHFCSNCGQAIDWGDEDRA